MTADQPLDRATRAWLELMPDEVPDRVIDAVLQAVETAPQARRPWLAGPTRSFRMNRLLLIAATAVVVAVLLGGAALIAGGRPSPNPALAPTAAPAITSTPSASAGPSDGAVPSSLGYTWFGASRSVPGLGASIQTTLTFEPPFVRLEGSDYIGSHLISQATLTTADRLRLTLVQDPSGLCAAGAQGTYSWTVSPGGTRLHLAAEDDGCPARSTAFAGDWYRVVPNGDCPVCFGPLEAGSYPTINFGPREDPDQPTRPLYDQMTYTVPDGWDIVSDHTSDIALIHSDQASAPVADEDVEVWIRPGANIQATPCVIGVDHSVATNAKALADWMASLPALQATTPKPITIDGNNGWWLDVQLASTFRRACDGFPRNDPLIAENVGTAGSVGNDPYGVGLANQERARYVFLDLGGGRTVMAIAHVVRPDTFDAFVQEAMPIIESLTFPHG